MMLAKLVTDMVNGKNKEGSIIMKNWEEIKVSKMS